MSKRPHDDESPVYDYLKRFDGREGAPAGAPYLPAKAERLTPALARRPEMQEYVEYIQTGSPSELATALVEGRMDRLEQRREMVNFVRRFVGLPARGVSPQKQIADVTRQLQKLYEQAAAMVQAKSELADAMINLATKQGKLELERETYEAKIAEQRRIKAEEEARMRQAEGTGGHAVRESTNELIARTAERAKDQFPKGSPERATWLRVEELARSGAAVADLFATVEPDQHEALKEKLRAAGIRVD